MPSEELKNELLTVIKLKRKFRKKLNVLHVLTSENRIDLIWDIKEDTLLVITSSFDEVTHTIMRFALSL